MPSDNRRGTFETHPASLGKQCRDAAGVASSDDRYNAAMPISHVCTSVYRLSNVPGRFGAFQQRAVQFDQFVSGRLGMHELHVGPRLLNPDTSGRFDRLPVFVHVAPRRLPVRIADLDGVLQRQRRQLVVVRDHLAQRITQQRDRPVERRRHDGPVAVDKVVDLDPGPIVNVVGYATKHSRLRHLDTLAERVDRVAECRRRPDRERHRHAQPILAVVLQQRHVDDHLAADKPNVLADGVLAGGNGHVEDDAPHRRVPFRLLQRGHQRANDRSPAVAPEQQVVIVAEHADRPVPVDDEVVGSDSDAISDPKRVVVDSLPEVGGDGAGDDLGRPFGAVLSIGIAEHIDGVPVQVGRRARLDDVATVADVAALQGASHFGVT